MGRLPTLKPGLQRLTPTLQGLPKAGDNRLRGRAAVDRRAKYLRLHPLCTECERDCRVTAGQVVDHKLPLWAGGQDDYATNGNVLCIPHHKAKSECEDRMRNAGGWLSTPCTCGQHRQGATV